MARLPVFNRSFIKVLDFITAYKLYIRMKMREITVEEQCYNLKLELRLHLGKG